MIVNQKQLAEILRLTTPRIRELQHDYSFFTKQENGRGYDLGNCVQEYIEYKSKAEAKQGTFVDKVKEQAEHERIKKHITELKLRKMKKELHEAADVEDFLSEMLINFKNKLLSIPNKVSVQILGETDINNIINLLNKEILETLEELSEYDPDKINGDVPEEDDEYDGESLKEDED